MLPFIATVILSASIGALVAHVVNRRVQERADRVRQTVADLLPELDHHVKLLAATATYTDAIRKGNRPLADRWLAEILRHAAALEALPELEMGDLADA